MGVIVDSELEKLEKYIIFDHFLKLKSWRD